MHNRRQLLKILSTAILAVQGSRKACGQSAEPGSPWYQRCLVGMEVGPTGAQFGHSDLQDSRYASRFDGAEIVRQCVAAGSEYLVMWVRDGDYAYYNSKILPKAPGLGHRDPLKEAVEEAHKHSLPVIAYCVVQQAGHFLKQHPEWEMRGADGNPLGRFSFHSGYLEAMKQILDEQMAYGIAGFHIDMLDQGFGPPYGCWADGSRAAFLKQYGHPMPEMTAGPSWDAAWDEILEFRYWSSQRFEQELAAHVRKQNPRVTVDFNYHGNPPFSWEVGQRPVQHAGNGDFVTGETGVWGFSALGVGLNAEFYRASTPGLPFQVAIQRGVRMYHDQTTRPTADMLWELMTLLSHGAFVTMVDKTAFDGSLDPVAYQRFSEIFDEALRKREHFGHRPVYDAGLYYSSRSRDWLGRENPGDWMQSFVGAHKALRYDQLQCGVALDENATLDSLQQFPTLLLCNAGILSQAEIQLLTKYVESGGGLIVTGQSGQYDRMGQPLSAQVVDELSSDSQSGDLDALQRLLGARPLNRLVSLDNWMRFDQPDDEESVSRGLFADTLPRNWPFLVKGPATVYQATTAQGLGKLMQPQRTSRQEQGREGTEWPMSAGEEVGPAVLLHRLGKGTVVTFAGSPDYATASEHHLVEARQLLTQAVRYLHPNPLVSIHAPNNIQTVVANDPDERMLRVHFLGYNAPPQAIPAKGRPHVLPALIEQAPMYRATVQLSHEYASARALHAETTMVQSDREIRLTIHAIHETLLIAY
jgi:hypothetical protein